MNNLRSFAVATLLATLPAAAKASPLRRNYRDGELLGYRISGTHAANGEITSSYDASESATVKKSTDGTFHEVINWTRVRMDGRDIALPPASREFRQLLSLDPSSEVSIPPLATLDSTLYAPMLDLMTFYADLRLAIKGNLVRKAGDHVLVPHGKPNSWADGRRITFAQDCIDFNISLVSLDSSSATLKVRHVPPRADCGEVPAAWMRRPVSDTISNWFQVEKKGDGDYIVGVGQEFFDAEIRITLPSGIIESATMYNPINGKERICKDSSLSDCGPTQKIKIVRSIKLSLEQHLKR